MSVPEKRHLPAKVHAMKARKRRKLDANPPHDRNEETNKRRPASSLNDLQWTEVQLPDRMDDYEGFFGLEEIDGIEVIKDEQSGNHRFHPLPSGSDGQHISRSAEADSTATTEDGWSGFDDASESKQHRLQSGTPSSILKKAKQSQVTGSSPLDTVSAFGALNDDDGSDGIDVSAWRSLKLSPDMMAALSRLSFKQPTLIQRESIPAILDGADVIGKASTGSGKTLAFGIPIIDRFLEQSDTVSSTNLFALILSPTRELAHQLDKHLSALAAGLTDRSPSIACLTGGLSLQKQQRLLQHANIIIATPGRLWELVGIEKGLSKSLQGIKFLVIDEADRLLSEGHFKEVEEILNVLDRQDDDPEDPSTNDAETDQDGEQRASERQTLVFSATFDKSLHTKLLGKGKSGGELLSNKASMEYLISKLNFGTTPRLIDVNPVKQLATGLREGLLECGAMEKDLYLYSIVLHHPTARVMVFTNSISAVRRIHPLLQNLNVPVLALHSGMPQKARLRSVERFTEASAQNKGSVLVATDVAARGLDIPNVQLVVHYNLPRAADMYVHRSGRTARAGNTGSSIIICSPEEANGVRKLVAKVHAQAATAQGLSLGQAKKQGFYIQTLDPDRKIAARLKPRVALAKKLADITIAKEKQHNEDDFLHAAAEELGVDYDSDEFQKKAPGRSGRGSGRKQRERQAQAVSKAEAAGLRAELKQLLQSRVNVGVSEKYITSGKMNIADLLAQQESGSKSGEFLGSSSGFGLDDD